MHSKVCQFPAIKFGIMIAGKGQGATMSETGISNEDSRPGLKLADSTSLAIQKRVAALYEANRDAVYRFLLIRGLESATAQELTQDTFVQFFIALSNGTMIEAERAWVYSVAAKSAVNHWRREGRFNHVALEASPELLGSLQSNQPTPEDVLIENQRIRRVDAQLARMSDMQKAAIHLRLQGLRYRAIAQVLQISPSTVSELLSGAITRLRSIANE